MDSFLWPTVVKELLFMLSILHYDFSGVLGQVP